MLAIIPARGGSRGLKKKNIKILNGLPLIAHSIISAKKSKKIKRIIVCTEDLEIAKIAKQYGAEVPFYRPKNLAKDNSMLMDSLFYFIEKINYIENKMYENFIVLLPTAPLRDAADIDNSINLFRRKKAQSVISMTEAFYPIEWNHTVSLEKRVKAYSKDFDAVTNRQKLKKTFIPNGAIFIFNYQLLKKTRKYYHKNTFAYIMPKDKSIDIDDIYDFKLAEFIIKK
jgi:CMP-N,N'-diacetyllegionaminic acid synthase